MWNKIDQLLVLGAVTGSAVAQWASTPTYNIIPEVGTPLNLNITASGTTYNVTSNDTIYSIAAKYNVGACDLARLNILADAEYIYAGMILNIPSRATFPDDYSCFSPNETTTTNTCILGGPHVYTILPGDTIQKIANVRFNITVESILTDTFTTEYISDLNPGPYTPLEAGETIKIPLCPTGACTLTNYNVTYGTLQDFATYYSTTSGQIMSLNLGYTHSQAGGPQLGVVYNCVDLSS